MPEKKYTFEQEVRTTSSTGGQKGVKPERYSLVPVEALASVARLYAFGAIKYAAHNWRLGYEWSKSYDSLFRHANASMAGEDYDEETGEPHLAGVVFHAFTLMCYLFDMERYGKFDDRYKAAPLELAESDEDDFADVVEALGVSGRDVFNNTENVLSRAEQIMQEYEGVVHTPIDQMIDYLAGMYENWSIQTSRELRRVAKDLRNDKNRNVKSFEEFHEQFPLAGFTGLEKMPFVGTHLTEIEPIMPVLDVRSMMLTIPTVVGAVYYYNDKHVVGSFQVRSRTDVTAVALPGYRFASNTDTMWTFVA